MEEKKTTTEVISAMIEPDIRRIPSFYINAASIAYNDYEVHLRFYLKEPGINEPFPVVDVRMSPQHAWVMSKLLERKLSEYVATVGTFELSETLLKNLNLLEEYERELKNR